MKNLYIDLDSDRLHCSLLVPWSSDIGFGELTMGITVGGTLWIDYEGRNKEDAKKILAKLIDLAEIKP